MLTSSSGIAYLGALSRDEREKLEAHLPEEAATECEAVWDRERVLLRREGYAFVQGEARYSKSINAVATPFAPPRSASLSRFSVAPMWMTSATSASMIRSAPSWCARSTV